MSTLYEHVVSFKSSTVRLTHGTLAGKTEFGGSSASNAAQVGLGPIIPGHGNLTQQTPTERAEQMVQQSTGPKQTLLCHL